MGSRSLKKISMKNPNRSLLPFTVILLVEMVIFFTFIWPSLPDGVNRILVSFLAGLVMAAIAIGIIEIVEFIKITGKK